MASSRPTTTSSGDLKSPESQSGAVMLLGAYVGWELFPVVIGVAAWNCSIGKDTAAATRAMALQ